MSILKSKTHAIGWTIAPYFIVTLSIKDLELLKVLQKFFNGVGKLAIVYNAIRTLSSSRNELLLILDHFKKYPIQTSKAVNFAYFWKIFDLMGSKVHTNVKGFLELVSLNNKLNTPLSSNILDKFSYLGCGVLPTQMWSLNPFLIANLV